MLIISDDGQSKVFGDKRKIEKRSKNISFVALSGNF
jgi:hypothetical protein